FDRISRRSLHPVGSAISSSIHARTKGAATHQPSGNALGNATTQQTFRALKARHLLEFSAFSAAACVGDTQTQGAASLCPGLTSSGAVGAKPKSPETGRWDPLEI